MAKMERGNVSERKEGLGLILWEIEKELYWDGGCLNLLKFESSLWRWIKIF